MMDSMIYVWVGFSFVIGAAVGSWLNVCIYRIPFEKSLLWPGSRCGNCFQPVRWYDNIPLVSYWVLRGRCRTCKSSFSPRYFLIELFTALVFAGLFYLDIVVNIHQVPYFKHQAYFIRVGAVPLQAWIFWLGHVLLASFLIITAVCDLDHLEVPLSVTVAGTLVGLLFAACCAWPWPSGLYDLPILRPRPGVVVAPILGFQPWPLWRPEALPSWLAPGTRTLGLATGLAGVVAGIVVVRAIRFLFGLGRGMEGLGLGDADLMMMAGAFLGWQATVIAFFVSVFPALVLGVVSIIARGNQAIPFVPSLALGIMITLYGWHSIGPHFATLFFDATLLILMGIVGSVLLLLVSFLLRLTRGVPPEEEEVTSGQGEIR
jgi:leader peptidase (prepilin peptidase) / N-methyltransferase